MTGNPDKANIQGVQIHLVKVHNNGRKADRSSIVWTHKGIVAALPTDPEKGCADKQKIISVDCQIDNSTVEKDMHECMTPEEP